jgi:hypothetical protein
MMEERQAGGANRSGGCGTSSSANCQSSPELRGRSPSLVGRFRPKRLALDRIPARAEAQLAQCRSLPRAMRSSGRLPAAA